MNSYWQDMISYRQCPKLYKNQSRCFDMFFPRNVAFNKSFTITKPRLVKLVFVQEANRILFLLLTVMIKK